MKLPDFSIRRPKLTIVLMIILILLGSISLTRLPMQLFPDIEAPVAAVATSYPGAGPQEVVNDVTAELEEDLGTVSGLEDMTSQSTEGSSLIILEFDWDTDIEDVENEIITTMNQAELPDGAENPNFLQFDPSMFPAVQLGIYEQDQSVTEFQDDVSEIQRELTRVEGVADVSESGSLTEEYQIQLDSDELEEANISQEDVVDTIQGHDVAMPGGVIEEEDENISTRVLHELTSEEDISSLVVSADPDTGDDITLDDVAAVSLESEDQEVITRANQEEALQMDMMLEEDADTTQVTSDFNEELDELLAEEQYEDLEVITLYSEGDFIEDAIDSVFMALIGGGLLAMATLFVFLRNLKTPLIIGIAIPLSVIVTFALFFFADITLNMMTLGGLALGIGMLIDNSIVVVENIYRHLSMKKTPKEAASDGTNEVAGAITASTLTTVAVFLPIVFVTGLVGDLFAPLGITVAFSLFASLIVALTIVPMIASRTLSPPREEIEERRWNSGFYKRVELSVEWVLKRRALVLVLTVLLLVAGAAGLTTVGTDLIPDSDEGTFIIEVEEEHGTPLAQTEETVIDIENELEEHDEIDHFLSTVGETSEQQAVMTSESHMAEVYVTMVPGGERDMTTIEFIEDIESEIEGTNDDADIQLMEMAQAGFGEPNTYSFNINDPDEQRLEDVSEELVEELEDENIINSADTSLEETAPELQIFIDEEDAQEEGMAPAQIAEIVSSAGTGETATTITDEDDDVYDVIVQYEDELTESVENFEELSFQNGDGDYITLADVADIEEGETTAGINRADTIPSVEFDVVYESDASLGEASIVIEEVVDDVDLHDDAEFVIGGDTDMMDEAFENMIMALALGLIFMYLVMVAQFESFKFPFVVMFTVPLSIIGVMLALTATQTPISVIAFIGIIVLAGIVVNNAIVLVDYINQRKRSGMDTFTAIVYGVKVRTRPILINALTTILGVSLLALGIGEGSETQQPMAIVVIGGLASSTLLTLFVIPVVYSLFDSETRSMNKKFMTPDGEIIYKRDIMGREQAPKDNNDPKELPEYTDSNNNTDQKKEDD